MLVPEILCGDTKTVATACRKHVARFRRGGSWLDVGTLVDVAANVPGLVMLEAPSSLVEGAHVRLYAPLWDLDNAMRHDRVPSEDRLADKVRAFHEALGCAWGILGMLSPICYSIFKDQERAMRFLKAVIACWDELDAVGQRYTTGLPSGGRLWDVAHSLQYAAAYARVPKSLLSGPLPPGGIAALLGPLSTSN